MKSRVKEARKRWNYRPQYLICLLIVSYVLLYEWGLFEADFLRNWATAAKLLVPGLLLVLIPIKRAPSRYFRLFILFYLLFMLWALAPGIVASDVQIVALGLTWLKYLPRAVFVFLVGLYFLRRPAAAVVVMKLLVIVAVLSVIQFCILVPAAIFEYVQGFYISGTRGLYFGPYGILGNQIAVMTFPGLSYPVFRLTGFWLEPSNASGFMFAVFFLSRVVCLSANSRFWRIMSYICLLGGFLCLSNAGYLAFAAPILFACLFMKKSGVKFVYVVVMAALAIGLVYFAIEGRSLANEEYNGSAALRALSGAREGPGADVYGGRIELLQKNVGVAITNPFGIGMTVAGEGGEGSYQEASASAPILWLAYTGFIGLILLLLRESQMLFVAIRYARNSPVVMAASQAWLAMFVQHLAYGTWMSPLYLALCAVVFSMVLYYEQTVGEEELAAPKGATRILRPMIRKPVLKGPTLSGLPTSALKP